MFNDLRLSSKPINCTGQNLSFVQFSLQSLLSCLHCDLFPLSILFTLWHFYSSFITSILTATNRVFVVTVIVLGFIMKCLLACWVHKKAWQCSSSLVVLLVSYSEEVQDVWYILCRDNLKMFKMSDTSCRGIIWRCSRCLIHAIEGHNVYQHTELGGLPHTSWENNRGEELLIL
jgi:hypothetical protein